MNLTIDIGNTQTKIIIFKDTVPVYREVCTSLTPAYLKRMIKQFPISATMLASVVKTNTTLLKYLKGLPEFEMLGQKTKLPIKNKYRSPATLGSDRLANAIAGTFLFPGKNVLIVDIGTCIKFDLVTMRKEYLGGSISPGMQMRFLALNHFTERLPVVQDANSVKLLGTTTEGAIRAGVIIGITEEISGLIKRYKKSYKNLKVILTGGDSPRFAGELKISIFAATDLVNIGLNEIIRFHNKKKRTG